MRAYVFTDAALASEAGRFVWLSINTDKAQNAPFKRQFPLEAMPSFFVIDPAAETVTIRWVGSMTVDQVRRMLDDGQAEMGTASPKDKTAAALWRADRFYGEGKNAEAAAAYREALATAPAGWPQYSRAVES